MTHLALLAIALLLQLVSGEANDSSDNCTGQGCNHTDRYVGIYVGIGVSILCIVFILILTILTVVIRYIKRRNSEHYVRIPNN